MLPFIHLGNFSLPTFGLMLWLAAVAAAFVMDRGFKRAHISADAVGMVAVAVVLGIVGAKLWHVIDTPYEFREEGWRVLWDTAGFAWFGGLVFGDFGAYISGMVGKDRRPANARSGGSCGCDRVRHWEDRVLSLGRWVLRPRDEFTLAPGDELSEWY